MDPLWMVAGAGALIVGALMGAPWWRRHRRLRLASGAFPSAWRKVLRRRMPLYRRLPADQQQNLCRHIQVFLAETPIMGCQGLKVSDDMRVLIAAQACLLRLGRAPSAGFPGVTQIQVYPSHFKVHRSHHDGSLVTETEDWLAGESWQEGRVILSWPDTVQGAREDRDGYNVVIHEMAHQLDQSKGRGNGMPQQRRKQDQREWTAAMADAYQRLCRAVRRGEETLIDPYGATNPEEFFAVACETFFECGPELQAWEPRLYAVLHRYFGVDTAQWT